MKNCSAVCDLKYQQELCKCLLHIFFIAVCFIGYQFKFGLLHNFYILFQLMKLLRVHVQLKKYIGTNQEMFFFNKYIVTIFVFLTQTKGCIILYLKKTSRWILKKKTRRIYMYFGQNYKLLMVYFHDIVHGWI
jgi:hypothetical protein